MNQQRLASLPESDQQLLVDVAQEVSSQRFDEVEAADERQLEALEAEGVNVVRLSTEQLQQLATFTREQVWPDIGDELGDDMMSELRTGLALD